MHIKEAPIFECYIDMSSLVAKTGKDDQIFDSILYFVMDA